MDEKLHVNVTFKSFFAAFILVLQEGFKMHIGLLLVTSPRVLALSLLAQLRVVIHVDLVRDGRNELRKHAVKFSVDVRHRLLWNLIDLLILLLSFVTRSVLIRRNVALSHCKTSKHLEY